MPASKDIFNSRLKKDDKPKVKVSHNNRNEYQLQ